MLPASNRGAGMNLGFPDVCNTIVGPATVPIPYPNIAMNAQALGFSPVVKVSMVNALNLGSKIPMTSGDEAGTAHPTVKGAGAYTMGNPIVMIDKLPAIHLTCPTTGNNMNNPVGAVLVPSAVNVLYCLANHCLASAEVEAPALLGDASDALSRRSVTSFAMLEAGVGTIRVASCSLDLASGVLDAAHRLETCGARAIVLDLRGNAGGDLDATVALARALLPDGAVVARVDDGDGDAAAPRAVGAPQCLVPFVALVDGGTASAAELIVASLQHHARAVVVGVRTYGKGWAWRVQVGPDGKPSVDASARWWRPDGTSVEGTGIEPDVVADPSAAAALAQVVATELAAEL
jgi:carboxyl-terminal processing protease